MGLCSWFAFVINFLKSASDNKTSIYTFASCGTDHLVKIWRIFSLADGVHMGSKTRLVPSTPQVCFLYNKSALRLDIDASYSFHH